MYLRVVPIQLGLEALGLILPTANLGQENAINHPILTISHESPNPPNVHRQDLETLHPPTLLVLPLKVQKLHKIVQLILQTDFLDPAVLHLLRDPLPIPFHLPGPAQVPLNLLPILLHQQRPVVDRRVFRHLLAGGYQHQPRV